jgi:hypothetical protein
MHAALRPRRSSSCALDVLLSCRPVPGAGEFEQAIRLHVQTRDQIVVFEETKEGYLIRRGRSHSRQRVREVRHFQGIEQRFQPVVYVATLSDDVSRRFRPQQGDGEIGHHTEARASHRDESKVSHRSDDQGSVVLGLKKGAMAIERKLVPQLLELLVEVLAQEMLIFGVAPGFQITAVVERKVQPGRPSRASRVGVREGVRRPGGDDELFIFLAFCTAFRSGGTRIRTGDTMIFSHIPRPLGMPQILIGKRFSVHRVSSNTA